jgi:hypothetical protein
MAVHLDKRGHAHPFQRPEAQSFWTLSWEDAQEAAGKWLGDQHLGRDLTGKNIDLTAAQMDFDGLFRKMVIEAVRRKIKKRGAREILLPPEELPGSGSNPA